MQQKEESQESVDQGKKEEIRRISTTRFEWVREQTLLEIREDNEEMQEFATR